MRNLLGRWVLGSFLLTAAAQAESAKHAITHPDLWTMPRVGAPKASPDGKWAVFSVNKPAYDTKNSSSELWLKSLTDDSPARQITFSKEGSSGMAWSPDGQRLAFAAKRSGDDQAQIYVLPISSPGEAVRVTQYKLGAREPKWSPDGKKLLIVGDVSSAPADRKYNARVYTTFPARFWNHWLDDRKAHLFVQEAAPGAAAKDLFAGTAYAASSTVGGMHDDSGEALTAEWTPDQAAVVFTAAVNRDDAARARLYAQVFKVPATGGEPQRLTHDHIDYGRARFSRSGNELICLMEPVTDRAFENMRLASFEWPAMGDPKILTSGFDGSISDFAEPAASGRLYFTSEHAGTETLFSVALGGGDVRAETNPAGGCLGGLAAAGSDLIGTWDSAVHPPEVVKITLPAGTVQTLTQFCTERIASLDLNPLEEFWTTSVKGMKMHSFVLKPPAFDPARKYPLFVVMHGGPASSWRDSWGLRWNYHLLAAPGYVLVLTDYTGSTGYGAAFAQSIQGDPLRGPGTEINAAADEAIRRYPFIDATRQAAGGASYGGHLANWMEATTTRYRCIVSHAGLFDLMSQWGTSDSIYSRELNNGGPVWEQGPIWKEQSPLFLGANHFSKTGFVTPILITVGELDFRVPMNESIENFAMEQRLGVPSKLIVFPEAFHWILRAEDSRFWFSEVHGWLARYLK
jgi:dipeptidyl aminopeptidase/acylaminoacyl peptidase